MKLLLFYSIIALTTFIIYNAKEIKSDIFKCDDDECHLNPKCCKMRTEKLSDQLNDNKRKTIGGVKEEKVKRNLMKKEQKNSFKKVKRNGCPWGTYTCNRGRGCCIPLG
ncbi:uncharacterized protein LOC136079640 [Hydra vulgaris]|uniref:Uncharacterized protein LOC136079640 n=1 Tax=Hydra vulgaris TaxID=6087 RepID=A0ABM4BRP1_HYDVU